MDDSWNSIIPQATSTAFKHDCRVDHLNSNQFSGASYVNDYDAESEVDIKFDESDFKDLDKDIQFTDDDDDNDYTLENGDDEIMQDSQQAGKSSILHSEEMQDSEFNLTLKSNLTPEQEQKSSHGQEQKIPHGLQLNFNPDKILEDISMKLKSQLQFNNTASNSASKSVQNLSTIAEEDVRLPYDVNDVEQIVANDSVEKVGVAQKNTSTVGDAQDISVVFERSICSERGSALHTRFDDLATTVLNDESGSENKSPLVERSISGTRGSYLNVTFENLSTVDDFKTGFSVTSSDNKDVKANDHEREVNGSKMTSDDQYIQENNKASEKILAVIKQSDNKSDFTNKTADKSDHFRERFELDMGTPKEKYEMVLADEFEVLHDPDYGNFSNNGLDMPNFSDEKFLSEDEGKQLLDQDEEAFNEKLFANSTDANKNEITFGPPKDSTFISNMSGLSDGGDGDLPYKRVTLGRFIRSRTKPLGSLENDDEERPNFGDGHFETPARTNIPKLFDMSPGSDEDADSEASSSDISPEANAENLDDTLFPENPKLEGGSPADSDGILGDKEMSKKIEKYKKFLSELKTNIVPSDVQMYDYNDNVSFTKQKDFSPHGESVTNISPTETLERKALFNGNTFLAEHSKDSLDHLMHPTEPSNVCEDKTYQETNTDGLSNELITPRVVRTDLYQRLLAKTAIPNANFSNTNARGSIDFHETIGDVFLESIAAADTNSTADHFVSKISDNEQTNDNKFSSERNISKSVDIDTLVDQSHAPRYLASEAVITDNSRKEVSKYSNYRDIDTNSIERVESISTKTDENIFSKEGFQTEKYLPTSKTNDSLASSRYLQNHYKDHSGKHFKPSFSTSFGDSSLTSSYEAMSHLAPPKLSNVAATDMYDHGMYDHEIKAQPSLKDKFDMANEVDDNFDLESNMTERTHGGKQQDNGRKVTEITSALKVPKSKTSTITTKHTLSMPELPEVPTLGDKKPANHKDKKSTDHKLIDDSLPAKNVDIGASGEETAQSERTSISKHQEGRADNRLQVVVPEEVSFAAPCCVGSWMRHAVKLFNPHNVWLQVMLRMRRLMLDGSVVDVQLKDSVFLFEQTSVVGPSGMDEIIVEFHPRTAGKYIGELSVDTRSLLSSTALPLASSTVLVQAESVLPRVEVEGDLDAGVVTTGNPVSKQLKLVNQSPCLVPVTLFLNTTSQLRDCFLLNGEYYHVQLVLPACDSQMISYTCKLSNNEDGKPSLQDDMECELEVLLNSPGYNLLCKEKLKASCAKAQLKIGGDKQTIELIGEVGQTASDNFTLHNTGNVVADVNLKVKCDVDVIVITPEQVSLFPGQSHDIFISCCSVGPRSSLQGIVEIKATPGDLLLQLGILVNTPTVTLKCNKTILFYGGVPITSHSILTTVFRNVSRVSTVTFTAKVRRNRDIFKLTTVDGNLAEPKAASLEQKAFNPEALRRLEVMPNNDLAVPVCFSPKADIAYQSKIVVQIENSTNKYMVWLYGYGGKSDLVPDGLLSTAPYVYSYHLSCGQQFLLRNLGTRAAFVCLSVKNELEDSEKVDDELIFEPRCFILPAKESQAVKCNLESIRWSSSHVILVQSGDEIIRQRIKQAQKIGQEIPEEFKELLKEFKHENIVNEAIRLPDLPPLLLLQSAVRSFRIKVVDDRHSFNADEHAFVPLLEDYSVMNSTAASMNMSCFLDKPVSFKAPHIPSSSSGPTVETKSLIESLSKSQQLRRGSLAVQTPLETTVSNDRDVSFGVRPKQKSLADVIVLHETIFPVTHVGETSQKELSVVDMRQSGTFTSLEIIQCGPAISKDGAKKLTNHQAIFHVTKSACMTNPGETLNIPVKFNPTFPGRWQQSWEVKLQSGMETAKRMVQFIGDASTPKPPIGESLVTVNEDVLDFGTVSVFTDNVVKLKISSRRTNRCPIVITVPGAPFYVSPKNSNVAIRPKHVMSLPVYFRPNEPGHFVQVLNVNVDDGQNLCVLLKGTASVTGD